MYLGFVAVRMCLSVQIKCAWSTVCVQVCRCRCVFRCVYRLCECIVCVHRCVSRYMKECVCVRAQVYLSQECVAVSSDV